MIRFSVHGVQGSGVNFVNRWLNCNYKLSKAQFRIDGGAEGIEFDSDSVPLHDMCEITDVFSVKIRAKTFQENLRIAYNDRISKRSNLHDTVAKALDNLDTTNIACYERKLAETMSKDWDEHVYNTAHVDLNYNDIFSQERMWEIYYTINQSIPNDNKIAYWQSYVFQHKKMWNSWLYKTVEKILCFEYNNKLQGTIRNWTADQITEQNHVQFLEDNLCLTNYH